MISVGKMMLTKFWIFLSIFIQKSMSWKLNIKTLMTPFLNFIFILSMGYLYISFLIRMISFFSSLLDFHFWLRTPLVLYFMVHFILNYMQLAEVHFFFSDFTPKTSEYYHLMVAQGVITDPLQKQAENVP